MGIHRINGKTPATSAARIVTLSNYETRSKDLLDDLGCEVLVERRMGKVAILMYK